MEKALEFTTTDNIKLLIKKEQKVETDV